MAKKIQQEEKAIERKNSPELQKKLQKHLVPSINLESDKFKSYMRPPRQSSQDQALFKSKISARKTDRSQKQKKVAKPQNDSNPKQFEMIPDGKLVIDFNKRP